MNLLEHLIAMLINGMVACSAQPIEAQHIMGHNYEVQTWVCQSTKGPFTIRVWLNECDTGRTKYRGRPFFLKFSEEGTAYYLNQFGEVMIGQGAMLNDAYQPPCGS